MKKRLQGLERIAIVYKAVEHAQALQLEQAASALREAEEMIARQQAQATHANVAARAALDVGDHVDWQMHRSQRQFNEWNADGLVRLRERRKALMLEAAEVYRAGRIQMEQMESVLRELRTKLAVERTHDAQRESDDRFLARQWWDANDDSDAGFAGNVPKKRMKSG